MGDKEMAMQLLDRVPDYKMGYVISYLQGIIDDEADESFCEGLIAEYEADNEKDNSVSIEKIADLCGVDLNEA